jgi:hypothetical protein
MSRAEKKRPAPARHRRIMSGHTSGEDRVASQPGFAGVILNTPVGFFVSPSPQTLPFSSPAETLAGGETLAT